MVLRRTSLLAVVPLAWALIASCEQPTEVRPDQVEETDTTIDEPFYIGGYHPYWLGDAWKMYDLSLLDRVYLFDLPVSADGRVDERRGWPAEWTGLIDAAHSAQTELHLTVSLLDAMTFEAVFSDRARAERLRGEIYSLSQSGSVDGIHLDIELFNPVNPVLRDSLTAFVEDLSRDIHMNRPEFNLSMFLLARDEFDMYDERRLSDALDDVVVQGYDLHWLADESAGPVAPVKGWGEKNWGSVIERFRAEKVPLRKSWISVPYYGYEWPTVGEEPGSATRGRGQLITFAPVLDGVPSAMQRVSEYGLRRDSTSGSPYYVFEDSTGWHQGWYEDSKSLSRKYSYAMDRGMAGIVIFPLGYDAGSLDQTIRGIRSGQVAGAQAPADTAFSSSPAQVELLEEAVSRGRHRIP